MLKFFLMGPLKQKTSGRVMAIDLGSKRMGLALSDPGRTISSALTVIARKGLKNDLEKLGALIREHEVSLLVVGLPLHLSGAESEGSARAREFAGKLEQEFGLPVRLVDESLSTVEAEEVLIEADVSRKKRKKSVDGLAAAVILRSWLNEQDEGGGHGT